MIFGRSWALLFVICAGIGCTKQVPVSQPSTANSPEKNNPETEKSPCYDLARRIVQMKSQITYADSDISAKAAEADLEKARFERTAKYQGSEAAQAAAPAYEQSVKSLTDAMRAKESLLRQKEALDVQSSNLGCH